MRGAELGGRYYVTGGLQENFKSVTTCISVDRVSGAEASISCPSQHRLGGDLLAIDGCLFLIGGSARGPEDAKRAPTHAIEMYEPETDHWSTLAARVPFDDPAQLRALASGRDILLYSAQRADATLGVALLDPEAMRLGRSHVLEVRDPRL